MNDPARELMLSLADGIVADETMADYFARIAGPAHDIGQPEIAAAFAAHGRMHRVKAIELRARLGAMVEQYGSLHRDGC